MKKIRNITEDYRLYITKDYTECFLIMCHKVTVTKFNYGLQVMELLLSQ